MDKSVFVSQFVLYNLTHSSARFPLHRKGIFVKNSLPTSLGQTTAFVPKCNTNNGTEEKCNASRALPNIVYGALILITGISKIQLSIDMIRLKNSRWSWAAVNAVLSLICAIVVLCNPFASTEVLWLFTGAVLVGVGIFDLVVAILRKKAKGEEPYATMTGAVIAFTALIPVAGAYIGAGVGAFMILTVSPAKAIIFLIFIVILQQLEGNLIYPRVVGSSLGLPAIWVLTAVTLGGGLMGIPGMLLCVPLAAALYRLVKEDVNRPQAKECVKV